MITNHELIETFFEEMNAVLEKKINVYIIGGAVLLRRNLKDGTKDIDIVVNSKVEFLEFQRALKIAGFKPQIPGDEYKHMNVSQIFQRGDFRIDVFYKEVCGKFSLTEGMIRRAETTQNLEHVNVMYCSNEDVFLFKTMTERAGDLDDCIQIALQGLDWEIILKELQYQIKRSKQDVWITWVGERLDILEDKGLEIPIMNKMNKLRDSYFKGLEKKGNL